MTSLMNGPEGCSCKTYRKGRGVSAQSHVMFVTIGGGTPVTGFQQSLMARKQVLIQVLTPQLKHKGKLLKSVSNKAIKQDQFSWIKLA